MSNSDVLAPILSLRLCPFSLFLPMAWLLALVVTTWLEACASAREPLPVYPLEGQPFMAALERVTSSGEIRFEGAGRQWEVHQIHRWGSLRENLVEPRVILAGGSELVTELAEIRAEAVTIGTPDSTLFRSTIWLESTLPRRWLRGVLNRPPVDSRERDALLEQLRGEQATDVAWLDNGDRLVGEFLGPRESDELLDPSLPWRWRLGRSELDIERSRLMAMAWKSETPSSRDDDLVRLHLGFRDGSLLRVQSVRRDDRVAGSVPLVRLRLGTDAEVVLDEATFHHQLCYLRPVQDRIRYASELTPLGYRHIPMFTLARPLGEDRNVLGGRLRHGESWVEKGLGMHSVSRVAYEVPAGAERFQAELAVDQSAGRQGSIEGRIYVQRGDQPWQLAGESPVLRGGDAPWPMDVELDGAERLALIVDHADLGSQGDRANWLHARFLLPASAP